MSLKPNTKRKNHVVSKVANILLSEGLFLDDILKVKEKESYLKAFNRCFKHNKGSGIVRLGKIKLSYKDLEQYCKEVDRPSKMREIPLARRIPISEIEEGLKPTRWKDLSYNEKLNVLYSLGLDVIATGDNETTATKYHVERQNYRDSKSNGKVTNGLVIIASERVDKEWLKSGYASDEAKLYTDDESLARELRKVAGGGM